jgi:hypothetical protein
MVQSNVTSDVGPILDTMIGLTRLTPMQRVIVAGSESMELYLELRRRGFFRATTPELCRRPRVQHAIGFIAGHGALAGIEPSLDQISAFLAVNAGLALLVGSGQNGLQIRRKLEALGFRIEAGVRCSQGLVLSASRHGYQQLARAA